MTFRAVILGLFLALLIAGGTHFNDWIVYQTRFTGNLFPVSVFGSVVLLTLIIMPLTGWRQPGHALQSSEIALAAALALAVCSWPGASYFRYFAAVLVLPSHMEKTRPNWQAAQVMAYVPDGSHLLGEGHLRQVPQLALKLHDPSQATELDATARSVLTHVRDLLDPDTQQLVARLAQSGRANAQDRQRLVRGLNRLLQQSALQARLPSVEPWSQLQALEPERAGRAVLQLTLSEHVLPPPPGQGVLLLGGRSDPEVTETMIQGAYKGPGSWLSPLDLPWGAWWPSIRFWGGLAVFMGLASLCMMLIVHPQWSDRELLPYPIARFVEELTAQTSGRRWPTIAYSRLFWLGFGLMVFLHVLNGLRAWYPQFFLYIPLRFELGALQTLFPNVSRTEGVGALFNPRFVPSVIAFAFFLTSTVSFSVGIALPLWAIVYGTLVSQGVTMHGRWTDFGQHNLALAGACLGIVAMALYAGRRHYGDVARGMIGLPTLTPTPRYCVWSARFLVILVAISVFWLAQAGLDWVLGLPLVLLILADYLAVARVNVETGAIVVQPRWLTVAVLTTLLGIEAIGPTTYLILSLASVLQQMDLREVATGMFANALRLGQRTGNLVPSRLGPALATLFLMGGVVALVMTLTLQYNFGVAPQDIYARNTVAPFSLDRMTAHLADLSATDRLENAMQLSGFNRLLYAQPVTDAVLWLGLGLGLVLACALARLRLTWWPLHPVVFVFWGTWPVARFGWSFLAGWLIKTALVKFAGSKGYHQAKPLMIGIIAGELAMSLVLIVIGATYYLVTGLSPPIYIVFPE